MSLAGLRVSIRARRRPFMLLAASALCAAAAAWMIAAFLAKPDAGLVYIRPEAVFREGRVVFFPREPFSPVVAAGLLPGVDSITHVNGLPVKGTLDVVRADSAIDSYRPITIGLIRGGEIRSVTFSPVSRLLHIDWLFMAIPALCLAYAAFSISLRAANRPCAPFFVFSALGCLLSLCSAPFSFQSIAMNALCNLGSMAAALFVVSGLFFPGPRGPRRLRRAAISGILLAGAAFTLLRVMVFGRWLGSGSEDLMECYRRIGLAGLAAAGIGFGVWAALAARVYARSSLRTEKYRIQWMLAAVLVALPPWACFQLLPRALEAASMHARLGSLSSLFLAPVPVLLAAGVAGRALAGPRFPLTRVALSAGLFIAAFAVFAALYIPLRSAVSEGYGIASPLCDLFTAALGFLILAPLSMVASLLLDRLLPLGKSRRASYVAQLERANAELEAALKDAREKGRRLLTAEKLCDLRSMMKGFAARIREPAARVSACLAAVEEWAGTRRSSDGMPALDEALGASLHIEDVARRMDAASGSSVSVPAVTMIEVLARTAMERVKRKFPHSRFAAEFGGGRVSCFPEELVDAFAGALENAVEAQEGSFEPISVSAAGGEKGEGARVMIVIDDNGMGMTDADMKRIFRPFFTTKPGHHGLGLFFCRLIVERNGGDIALERREAGGVRCRMTFPAADSGEAL